MLGHVPGNRAAFQTELGQDSYLRQTIPTRGFHRHDAANTSTRVQFPNYVVNNNKLVGSRRSLHKAAASSFTLQQTFL